MSRLFCFGLGYSAAVLAQRLAAAGWTIAGTTREEESCAPLRALGYEMQPFSRVRPLKSVATIDGATHVLLSIPPDASGDPAEPLCSDALSRAPLRWVGYLSTTVVYGDRGGAWVDEDTPPAPTTERGRRRVAAELAWRTHMHRTGLPLHVFRLAGIYGPGRSAFDLLRSGAARVSKPGHVFSRIHVEDLATVLGASMQRPAPGGIYNVCDDEPAPQSEVIAYAARLSGRTAPAETPIEKASLSDMARSFYAENKRVSNRRIKTELGVRLSYPTYRDGLAAILAAEASARVPPGAPR